MPTAVAAIQRQHVEAFMNELHARTKPGTALPNEDLRALLAACAGKVFEDKRDTAIVRLLVDTGMRRAELLGLRVIDIDFDQDVALVIGKGSKGRACPFGSKTVLALGRYLRLRSGHPFAASPALWLGKKGPLTETGLTQMLWRRGGQAGIGKIHPTSSATPSPTPGWPRAGTRAISSG
jgi:site-specific recombinase XerD